MNKHPNDASCAKLLLKKASGYLKISLTMFLISITITSVIGLLYARQYFQYRKDFVENISIRTVSVDASYEDSSLHAISPEDIAKIKFLLSSNLPNCKADVIPVYTCSGLNMNGTSINLFAIDSTQCYLTGLNNMVDNTAYFIKQQPSSMTIEISVITELNEEGFQSGKLERINLRTDKGVSKNTPLLTIQNQYLLPSISEIPTCFVNLNTFNNIVSTLLDQKVENINETITGNELVRVTGIFVCVDDLHLISNVSSLLTENNYRTYAPADAFDNFGETVSIGLFVFFLSSIVLLCMTTVNIVLSFWSFYRVQQKDMGILRYMGFSNHRIYNMYRKNLSRKFKRITVTISFVVFFVGMMIFSFNHWFVLVCFILSLIVFLITIFFIILRLIVYKYINQDILLLIRESKEFE